MRTILAAAVMAALLVALAGPASAEGKLEAIKSVEIGKNAELRVNGKPFLPLMIWLQGESMIKQCQASGINTIAGQSSKSDSKKFLDALGAAGMYGVMLSTKDDAAVVDHPARLGWIQGDEPDMDRESSDAVIEPAGTVAKDVPAGLIRLVDGDPKTAAKIDPLEGFAATIKLKAPVTVQSLAVTLMTGDDLQVAKEMVFLGDGKEIAKAALESKKGEQKIALNTPATFKELTFKVTAIYPATKNYGRIAAIVALDKDGRDVLESKIRVAPRTPVAQIKSAYEAFKSIDKQRPVFMTFTGNFNPSGSKYDQAQIQQIYPTFARFADVVGFDTYPIYGSGTPGRLVEVADDVALLRALIGPGKPIYAWIETSKGSKWMSFDRQPDVLPIHTRFETWSALIRGATAIGYFTHRWAPTYKSFGLEPEMVTELKRLNDQITRLAPALLSNPAEQKVAMAQADDLACHFKATVLDGAIYVFAQNLDLGPNQEKPKQFAPIAPRTGKATFAVEGLKAGTKIEVVDENRVIEAQAGCFTDEFSPLAEHIYKIEAK